MKNIYDLKIALEMDPSRVELTQKLTLDKSRPHMGLEGMYGLFASPDWWGKLKSGDIPTKVYEGMIESLQFEGMNNEGRSFTLAREEGEPYTYSCIANNKEDLQMYKLGQKARITVLLEKKKNGDVLDMVWAIEIGGAKNV